MYMFGPFLMNRNSAIEELMTMPEADCARRSGDYVFLPRCGSTLEQPCPLWKKENSDR